MAETKFLDSVGLAHLSEKINAKFSKISHTHTKAEITDFAHTHNDLYYGKTEVDSKLGGKANTGHNHDDMYYTESEINSKLAAKSDTSHSHSTHLTTEIAASTDLNTVKVTGWYKCHLNNTAASLKNCPTQNAFAMEVLSGADITQILYEYMTSGQKVYMRNCYAGEWGEWKRIYTTANKPTAGEIGAASSSHTHTKAEVGLGNVDNTADSEKSVKYATSAGSATTAVTADALNVTGLTTQNLDKIKTVGLYYAGGSNSVKNKPADVDAFGLEVKKTAGGYLVQVLTEGNVHTMKTWIRQFDASAWSDWEHYFDSRHTPTWSQVSGKPTTFAPSAHNHNDLYYTEAEVDGKLSGKAASSHKHGAGDITSVNASAISGVIAAANLPSFVDDVLEGYYGSDGVFYKRLDTSTGKYSDAYTGETGKIYVDLNTNKTYRWSGSKYVVVSETIALGETASTAYRGDRGKVAYDHAAAKGSAFASGLYKIATNAQGHVTAATAVGKGDITALGVPAQDTVYTHPTSSGNKHIPSGGAAGQFLKWSADGTAVWAADNNTTYSNFKGATSSAAGGSGLVPAPATGAANRYLRSDGTWQVPPDTNTTYNAITNAEIDAVFTAVFG